MSIKTKLSCVMSLIVILILIANNTLHYFSTRDALLRDQQHQMEMIAKEIRIAIEHSQTGAKHVEDLIGRELRTAAVAALHQLDPDIANVTNEQLRVLADQLGISDITLFAPTDDDIKALKSSDPKEVGLSTKDWGYWYVAMRQLLEYGEARIPEGQKLANYWAGPIDVASSDPTHLNKWGYYYDGTTNYIIDPYMKDVDILEFERLVGPKAVLDKTLADNPDLLEITGFNPKAFGKDPIVTKNNGVEYVERGNRPILFGEYRFQNEESDLLFLEQAVQSGRLVTFNGTLNGFHVIKSFIPIDSEQPYVIGVVTDYRVIQEVLNRQLLNNVLISLVLAGCVFALSYLVAGRIVRPVHRILERVNEIADGNFGVKVQIDRRDELGLLGNHVNIMSENLLIYTNELKDKQEQIRYQADHDPLTGLPNRRKFNNTLKVAIEEADRSGRQVSVMYLDIDRFKTINDTLGHGMGDLLLQEVAERLLECVRPNQTVARLGGDEFTVTIPLSESPEEVARLAETIIAQLAEPILVSGYELFITPSIGICTFPQDGEDIETLLKHADTAMYHAKEAGGNDYAVYRTEMNNTAYERMELENRLRKALEREEFELHYQPKMCLKSGAISGMETLIRWSCPDLGPVSPAKFIPVAEETGLILPLGEWVLRTACRQASDWQSAGYPPLRVAVNLSARQFLHANLAETVGMILRETGLDPQWLELEITESTLMQNTEKTLTTLHELKQRGIRISIDDFGTGYSSLNYLKRFPFDSLKIDQSFVRDIAADRKDAEIVAAIISLAHSLELKVVAEGVETPEQLHFLRDHHCDEMQGYFFHRPLPVSAFEQLLKKITRS